MEMVLSELYDVSFSSLINEKKCLCSVSLALQAVQMKLRIATINALRLLSTSTQNALNKYELLFFELLLCLSNILLYVVVSVSKCEAQMHVQVFIFVF